MFLNRRIYLIICISFVNLYLLLAQTDTIIIKEIDESFLVNYNKDIPSDTNLILITNAEQINTHLKKCDGVMIGRAIYQNPYFLAEIENKIFNNTDVPSRSEIAEKLVEYVQEEVKKGTRLNQIMRHTLGLFHGQSGASYWKRYLSKNMCVRDADVQKINHIMDKIKYNNIERRVG
mgnify:CR=1 FL=1